MIARLGLVLCSLLLAPVAAHAAGPPARIKDIVSIRDLQDIQLVGYGLVFGLKGTGDSLKNIPFTDQALQTLLDNMGINVRGASLRSKNVAAVIATADLPPFVGPGSRIDVHVSSLGDATSLAGGALVLTPLASADGARYATAQGPVVVTGFDAAGSAQTLTQGVPTAGRIPGGAIIERRNPNGQHTATLVLELRNPDFLTATRVADAINAFSSNHFGVRLARELDMSAIEVAIPKGQSASRLVAALGELTVEPDLPARVVVDERTGTIVIGDAVTVSTVAVTHGSISVQVTESPSVSQPEPLSNGSTTVVPSTAIGVAQPGGHMAILHGTDLRSLVSGLNAVGLKPPGIIAILQAIKSAGALNAELVIQ